jgi:uridylate kinase
LSATGLAYQRILLKLSGEALMGEDRFGINDAALAFYQEQIAELVDAGVQLGVVVGGGNIFRGLGGAASGMDRVQADTMGMLATAINGIALSEYLNRHQIHAQVQSALPIGDVVAPYNREQARAHLERGGVVVFVSGTGNPFFTTDTAASLRAVEIGAGLLVKATKVDGVYSADPVRDPTATRYDVLSYDEALAKQLGVMDATAIALCRDNRLPVRVCSVRSKGNLLAIAKGQEVGTLVNLEGKA